MSEIPWRAELVRRDDGQLVVPLPEHIEDAASLHEGNVVTASLLLDSGDVPSEDELQRQGEQ